MLLSQLIIIQVITFAALVIILRKIMYFSSIRETKRLQLLNKENTIKLQELSKKLEEAEQQYNEKILKAEEEIKKAKALAKEEMDKLKETVLNQAKQESRQIVEQAINVKEKIREELEAQLQDRAAAFSLKLIKDVLSLESMRSFHEGFIDDAISEIEGIDLAKLGIKIDKGELIAPYEITGGKKEKIKEIFLKKTDKNILWDEKIDKEIIAGIVIKLGSFVIDGSLSGRLRNAAEALKK